jgi:hypothetical protein
MSKKFRVDREWVPLKQYLPTQTYAQLQDLIQNDVIYKDLHGVGNEQPLNGMIRWIVTEWLQYRSQIEEMSGTAKARREKLKRLKDLQDYIESLHEDLRECIESLHEEQKPKEEAPTQETLDLDESSER